MATPNPVPELDSTSLRPFVDEYEVVLLAVLMILPQIRETQTQALVPILQSIAASSKSEKSGQIGLAYINAHGNWDAVKDFGITTYPHVMLLRGWGDQRVYRGAFTESSITSYLHRFLEFPEVTRVNAATLHDFRSSSEVVVVGYTVSGNASLPARFEALAKSLHPEVIFGMTEDAYFAKAETMDVPAMVVYNNSPNEIFKLPITEDVEEMKAIIRRAALPLILNLYPEIQEGLLDLGTPFAYIFTETADEELRVLIADLARKHRGKIQFSIAPASRVPSIVEDLHLDTSTFPAFAIREPISNHRYPMPPLSPDCPPQEFLAAVAEFVERYMAGKLQPTIKSSPIPPPTSSALIKVVGLTYHSIINDPTRDVLLTICIEKCGPCKILYPILEELAQAYRCEENDYDSSNSGEGGEGKGQDKGIGSKTTIATVLSDKNDIGIRGVRAFPTILLFAAKNKGKPVRYLGGRTVEGMRGIIEKHRNL